MSKILVIEDEEQVRAEISAILEANNFQVIGAENGFIGIQLAQQEQPDLILCDILMPGLDGYQVLTELRQNPLTAIIPLVFITAKIERADLRIGMDLGADDYLPKPFTIEELLSAIATRLKKQQTLRAERQQVITALQQAHQHLSLHVDNSPLAVIEWNEEFRVQRWSAQAERIFGWTLEEVIGKRPDQWKFIYSEDCQIVQSIISGLQNGNFPRDVTINRNYTKDGNIIYCDWYNSALYNESGQIVSILSLVQDITDRKQAELALQQLNQELEIRIQQRTKALSEANRQLQQQILERQKAEAALQESQALYQAIVEDQTELICRYLPDTTLTFVNGAYCRYFGKQRQDLIGVQFLPRMLEADRECFQTQLTLLTLENPVAECEHRVILASGEIRWQRWTNRALFDEQGQLVQYQAVGRDITTIKQAEAESRASLEKEKELSQLRTNFVSVVSHEFRTPLSTIVLSAEMLERYDSLWDEAKKRKHFERIRSATANMTALLNDVLEIGKAEEQKFCPTPIDLKAFCDELLEEMQFAGSDRHSIDFGYQGDCAGSCLDEKLLRQILGNLLSNAIKYSPEGGKIDFELDCTLEQTAIFTIRDRGIGIPPESFPGLFNPFYRANNVGRIPGTGLGLAIVKKSVDLHGGEIVVKSQVGTGTTFIVKLPISPE